MKKKPLYWITADLTDNHRYLSENLKDQGISIRFFNRVDELQKAFRAQRVTTIMVGDEGPPEIAGRLLENLTQNSEFYGVRFVLSLTPPLRSELTDLAWRLGVRDMIPIDLEFKHWHRRFVFSTSGKPIRFPVPQPRMTLRGICGLSIPARISWISGNRVRVEARIKATAGTTLKLKGPLAEHLGMKMISLAVESQDKSRLRYRYSDALVCRWQIPQTRMAKLNLILDHLARQDLDMAARVFLVAKSPELRTHVLKTLRNPRFEVASALSKQHILNEPSYFSPHLVMLEDSFCVPGEYRLIKKMAASLQPGVPVLVLGNKANLKELRHHCPDRKFFAVAHDRRDLENLILSRFIKPADMQVSGLDPEARNLPSDSPFSWGEVHFSARLTAIHPTAAQVAMPVNLANFTICRLESPLVGRILGRQVYAKITDTFPDYSGEGLAFPFLIDTFLVDVMESERQKLASRIGQLMVRQLNQSVNPDQLVDSQILPLHREPMVQAIPTAQQVQLPEVASEEKGEEAVASILQEPPPDPTEDIVVDRAQRIGKQVATKAPVTFEKLKPFITFIAVMAGVLALGSLIIPKLQKTYDRSGKRYTDSLEKFRDGLNR